MKKYLIFMALILTISEFLSGQTVRFVTQDGAGSKNGTSWGNAYDKTQLQTAINGLGLTTGLADEVWVAAGTYKPTTGADRSISFQLKNGVAIYGGFTGGETLLSQRNWTTNITGLSGDIGIIQGGYDNSYHVVYNTDLDNTAILDGFYIVGGEADDDSNGGGIHNKSSSPTLANCNISGNFTSGNGGGISNESLSSPVLTNCQILANQASAEGGGMYNSNSSPILTNCLIYGSAAEHGGGVSNANSSEPTLTNCTITGNAALSGGGIYTISSSPIINNSIIWGNNGNNNGNQLYIFGSSGTTQLNYCCYPIPPNDVYAPNFLNLIVTNCINQSPQFANSISDLSLAGNSPCADAGSDTYNNEEFDIRGPGFERKLSKTDGSPGTIDIGAYEYKFGTDPELASVTMIYVNENASGADDGSSWDDAFLSLQSALDATTTGDYEIWVATGTYLPTKDEYGDPDPLDPRTKCFQMKSDVAIYGGFAGDESIRTDRNLADNITILSGDIETQGDKSDNSYYVVYNTYIDNTAVLDGFTIQCGFVNIDGGDNSGAGMHNYHSSPTLTNCTISGNNAISYGGGIYNYFYSSPIMTNCLITGNSAANGGGVCNIFYSSPTLNNCTISGNSAQDGGGLYNSSSTYPSSPTINNSIIWGNTATSNGNQLYIEDGTTTLNNSCYADGSNDVYDNGTVNFTDCITTNPQFVNSTDFRIAGNSPCVDAGNGSFNNEQFDIRSQERIQNIIDMGAYEWTNVIDPGEPQIIYVNSGASGNNDGSSWTDAYNSLQSALTAATSGYEIWVAAGTYYPTDDGDRNISFQMINGVAIYGGFAGTETSFNERNWNTNVTILSGDIGTPDNRSDNAYHVVYNSGIDNSAVLDGFTIQKGEADIYDGENSGAGVYNISSSPTLTNCEILDNYAYSGGGGVLNYDQSSPIMTNCTVSNNSSAWGGGIYNDGSSPIMINCLIVDNSGNSPGGGVANVNSSSAMLTNCTISKNSSSAYGGGIFNSSSSLTLNNSIIWGNNSSGTGYQISMESGTVTLNYSCYSDGSGDVDIDNGTVTADANCITTDPLFFNAASYDYRIFGNSPCADVGNDDYNSETSDIRGPGFGRKLLKTDAYSLGTIDMGAYEFKNGTDPDPVMQIIYVDASITGGSDEGTSWENAYTSMQTALTDAAPYSEIWVAAGTYKPTTGTDRSISFSMKNDVTIYGGFAGTENLRSERNWATHPTILSGDIGTPGNNFDNSYHVINNSGLDNTAVLDGFTIQRGYSDDNFGAGVNNSLSSPILANCTISGNYAVLGGGVANYYSSPTLTNCIISGNSAWGSSLTAGWGGGMYNYDHSNPTLTNCTVSGNTTSNYGGGIANSMSCSPNIYNSIIWGNTGTTGKQIYNLNAATSLYFSCYADGTGDVVIGGSGTISPDAHCITTDPLFVNAAISNYRLIGISNCINTGNNGFNSSDFDIRGLARIQNTTIDMGAYEWTSSVDPYGNLFTWTGNTSTDWNIPENWNTTTVPSGTDAALIPTVTNFPKVSNPAASPAVCYNLTLGSNATLTVNSGGALTVNGTLVNDNGSGVSNLVVESGGSLITNSNPAATVKRTINGWTDANHGWHFLSSPVATQSISSGFIDGIPENYDFYAWWELTNEWVNYKNSTTAPVWNTANVLGSTNGAGNFIPGKGYLVAYSANSTKQFAGNLNNVKIQISGLTKSTGINRGWHLLGNPFPSALKWNDGNWALSQITGTAKIWKESIASYVDIAANGIIPAANGFMVETSGDGSLTIPMASRTHNATVFYKSTETEIKLVAHDTQNLTAQETIIRINNQATEYFNPAVDSHFLPGYAPQFYSVKGNENLSTNWLPALYNREIPMGFVKNDATSFNIELDAGSMAPGQAVYLTDKKTGTITNLNANPVYNFTSDEGDEVNRFILKFGTLGINDFTETGPSPVIWQQGDRLYFQNIEKYIQFTVYDMQGRKVQTGALQGDASQNIGFSKPAGVYIVRLSNHNSFINTKIIVY